MIYEQRGAGGEEAPGAGVHSNILIVEARDKDVGRRPELFALSFVVRM